MAGKNLATATAKKLAQKAAQTAARCGVKAVAKMGTTLGIKLAEMGAKESAKAALGPVGWAMMAFDVLTLGLDLADPGGYGKLQTLDMIYKQRDGVRTKAAQQQGFPYTVGPLTGLSDADSQALLGQVMQDYITEQTADVAAGLDPNLTDEQQDAALKPYEDKISDYLATDAGFAELFNKACAAVSGKPVGEDCSWPDADSCNNSYKWPMADDSSDIFTHWTGDHCEASAAQSVRKLCDDAGLQYDFAEEVCKLTNEYCLSKGANTVANAKHGGATDCKVPWTQQALEAFFGTTITRGIKQIIDIRQYETCNPATEWGWEQLPGPLKTFLNLPIGPMMFPPLAILNKSSQMFCFDKSTKACPDGMENSRGLCYVPCKQGYKSDGATACYRQYDGWEQNDATTLLNVGKVLHANPGMPLSSCPANQDKEGALCYDKPKDGYHRILSTAWQNCPEGWKDDGAFCRQDAYDRGRGYPWKFGDDGTFKGRYARCTKDNPQGCENAPGDQIVYPKCRSGFNGRSFMCWPSCSAVGMAGDTGSCPKGSYTVGTHLLGCRDGQTQDSLGLCYDPCPAGTHKTTLGMCDSGCPDGTKDIGVSCMRETYNRGVGVIPWSMRAKKRIAPYGHK